MFYLILDTETTNSIDDPIMYDLGFSVIDENGEVYESRSFVIREVFLNPDLMASAYFADKIPTYWEEIKCGKRKLVTLAHAHFALVSLMRKYGIDTVVAHNCRFDYLSTNFTQRYITKSKYRFFFPYGTKFLCTLQMAKKVFSKNEEYLSFCKENSYTTKWGAPRYTAEILYRFISGDNSFVESHTGFEDTEIERQIFAICAKRMEIAGGYLW